MNEVYTLWATAFAGASAFAALLTALISARALRQAERARKEASKPEVIVDALYEGNWAVLRIRNIGGGAARDIKFSARSIRYLILSKDLTRMRY